MMTLPGSPPKARKLCHPGQGSDTVLDGEVSAGLGVVKEAECAGPAVERHDRQVTLGDGRALPFRHGRGPVEEAATVDPDHHRLASLRVEGGVVMLDRILLTLIVAEFAYTLRGVFEKHEVSAEPFLFIGLIAVVRRVLIMTAEFEQPQTDARLNNLLLEPGMLGVLVLGLAAAIFLIRSSSGRRATHPATVQPPAPEH
jgi:uncharacterized membrane protein (DUF373 family)